MPPSLAAVIFAPFSRTHKRNVDRDGNVSWDDYKVRSR